MKTFKQSTLFLMGVLLLAVTSCKKTDVAPAAENKLSAANAENASSSVAQVFKYHDTINLADPKWREYNACTGELINITKGIWHIDLMYIVNGNIFTLVDHSNVSGYKLINLTTGVTYTGSYFSNTSFTGNISAEQPLEITGTSLILLTTRGGGNNGKLLVDYHLTINANDEVTVDFYNERAVCQ